MKETGKKPRLAEGHFPLYQQSELVRRQHQVTCWPAHSISPHEARQVPEPQMCSLPAMSGHRPCCHPSFAEVSHALQPQGKGLNGALTPQPSTAAVGAEPS